MIIATFLVDALQSDLGQTWALTLLHFTWQATLVMFIAAGLLHLLRRSQATSRYLICLAAMITLVISPLVTFFLVEPSTPVMYDHRPITSQGDAGLSALASPDLSGAGWSASGETLSPLTPWSSIPTTLETAELNLTTANGPQDLLLAVQPWLLLIWLVGVALLSIRLMTAAYAGQRIKREGIALPIHIQPTLAKLCARMGMAKLPRLIVSHRVEEAAVLGFLKPVLLLPASWATQMPTEMLEAVIAHELAHLRRFDLWFNLFQRIVETTFFFHPAVWWISQRMRIERELCCDAAAVEATDDRLVFAQTLEFVARQRSAGVGSALSLQMGGSSMPLLKRVRHILGVNPQPTSHWLSGVVTMALPVLIVVASLNVFPSFFDAPEAAAFAADDDNEEPRDREGEKRDREGERADREGEKRDRDGERADREGEKRDREGERADREGERRNRERHDDDRERNDRDRERHDDDRERGDRDGEHSRESRGDAERREVEQHMRGLHQRLERLHNVRRNVARERGENHPEVRELSQAIEKTQKEIKTVHSRLEQRNGDRERGEGDPFAGRDRPRGDDGDRDDERHREGDSDREHRQPGPQLRELHQRLERLNKQRRDVARERGEDHAEVRELNGAVQRTESEIREVHEQMERRDRELQRPPNDRERAEAARARERDERARAEQMGRLINMVRELREENAKLRREVQEIRRHVGREGSRGEGDRPRESDRREGDKREGDREESKRDGERRERERD